MKLNQLIVGLQSKVRGDRRLAYLLAAIASGAVTNAQREEFIGLVTRLFYVSELTGYQWQSGAVRRNTTNQGLVRIARESVSTGGIVGNQIIEMLEKRPELGQVFRESVLGQASVRQGVGDGQLVSAEEANLGFKRWLHLGRGATDRPHHLDMDGVTIPRNERFKMPNGISVMAAHDWNSAGAKEWINCSCQTVYLPRQ